MRHIASHRRALFTVMAAQFLSSLADNALLIAAISLLAERDAPAWMTPSIRMCFYLSYVVFAPFAGAVADMVPKGRVILGTSVLKLCGAGLLVAHIHPLLAYGLVGVGAAAYSPAKYGILPEILPPSKLIAANAWMESLTVLSIILGVGVGSVLLQPWQVLHYQSASVATSASATIGLIYLLATFFAAAIPLSIAQERNGAQNLLGLISGFFASQRQLWQDHAARVSLTVTSLFWAVSAVLQFVVLRWSEKILHLPLDKGALLQIAVAIGMVGGAVLAGRWLALRNALSVLPLGLAVGLTVLAIALVKTVWTAALLLVLIGLLSGVFVVPMNALLQDRGNALMRPGQAIAVQNCNESLASLVLLGIYGGLLYVNGPLLPIIVGFGAFVSVAMLLIIALARRSSRGATVRTEQDPIMTE
jgi:LPLT family lysophospholipid transporter-like MFS transporter